MEFQKQQGREIRRNGLGHKAQIAGKQRFAILIDHVDIPFSLSSVLHDTVLSLSDPAGFLFEIRRKKINAQSANDGHDAQKLPGGNGLVEEQVR